MATEQLEFKLTADTTGLDSGMKNAIKTFDNLGKRVGEINKQISSRAVAGTAGIFDFAKKINLTDVFPDLTRAGATLKKLPLDHVRKKLGEIRFALAGAGVDIKQFGGGIRDQMRQAVNVFNALQPSILKTRVAFEKIKSSDAFTKMTSGLNLTKVQLNATASAATNYFTRWESGIGVLNRLSSSLWVVSMGAKQAAIGITLAMAPLGILGGLAIKTSMSIEKSAASIQAAAGWYGEAGRALREQLTKNLKEVSMVMPESIANLQEYAYAAAQAGVSTVDQLTKFSVAMAQLRVTQKDYVGGNKDLADLLAKTSIAFKIPFENIDRVASVIARAAMATTGGLKEIVDGLSGATGGSIAFGVSLATTTGMIQTVIPRIRSASRAGTQLSQTFNKMATHFDVAAKQMGMSSQEMVDRMNTDMEGLVMQYIQWLKYSGGAVSDINKLTAIWGQDTARVLQILVENYEELTRNIAESKREFEEADTLTKAYNVTADTMAGTWQKFRNVLTVLVDEIGDSINRSVGNLLNVFIQIAVAGLAAWRSLGEGIQRFIILLGGLAVAAGPLLLIFAKIFIDPLAGIVTMTAKLGKLLITTGLLTKAAIRSGIAHTFEAGAISATGKAAKLTTGSLLTQAYASGVAASGGGVLARVFAGLEGMFRALSPIILRLGTVLLALAGVAIAIGAAFRVNLFGISDKFKGIFSGLKKGMGDANKVIGDKAPYVELEKNLTKAGDKASELKKKVGGTGKAMVEIAGKWGNKMVEKYIKAFSDLDVQVMHRMVEIAKQVFDEQEKLGRMTAEQVYNLTSSAQSLIAKMISQFKESGKVVSGVRSKLAGLIGGARVGSIIAEIKAAIKVDKIQEALDKVKKNLKKLQERAKEAVDALEKQLKEMRKTLERAEKPLEDEIKKLQKAVKRLKKAQEEELKPLKEAIKSQKDVVDSLRDQASDIKKEHDKYLNVLKDQKTALQKQIKSIKKAVDELEKLRKKEVDAAKGMVEYHKMNYDAANRQLEMETSMGRDEFDITWRLAKARAGAASDQVTLAKNQLAHLETAYDDQVEAQQSTIDTIQEQVDLFDDQIDTQQEIYDNIEEALEDQLELAENELETMQDNYDARKEIWENQITLLEDQLEVQETALDEMKSAHQEIIDTLEDEKNALQEKYDTEIATEEEKVKAAEQSLDAAKKAYDKIQAINQELLSMESSRIGAEKGPSGGGGGGGGAAIEGLDTEEMEKSASRFKERLDELLNPPEEAKGAGWTSGLLDGINRFFSAIENSTVLATFGEKLLQLGGIIRQVFADNKPFQQALGVIRDFAGEFWSVLVEAWKAMWGMIGRIGTLAGTILWQIIESIWKGIILIFKGYAEIFMGEIIILGGLLSGNWTMIWEGIRDFIKGMWQSLVWWIVDLAIWLYKQLVGGSIFQNLANGIINIFKGLWNKTVSIWDSIKNAIYNAAKYVYDQVTEKWNSMKSYINEILHNILSAVQEKWDNIKSKISDVLDAIWEKVKTSWNNIKQTIIDVANSIWDSIKEAWKSLKENIGGVMGEVASVVKDAFKDSFQWGKHMMENLVKGIKDAWERGKESVGEIVKWIVDKLGFSVNKYMPAKIWGKHMIENFAKGIEISTPEVEKSLNTLQESLDNLQKFSIPSNISLSAIDTSALARSSEYAVKPAQTQQTPAQNVTSNSGNTYNINPGMMVASKGEIREFARLLNKYLAAEEARIS